MDTQVKGRAGIYNRTSLSLRKLGITYFSFIIVFQVTNIYSYHQIVIFFMALRYIQTLKMTSYPLVLVAVTVIVEHARVQV